MTKPLALLVCLALAGCAKKDQPAVADAAPPDVVATADAGAAPDDDAGATAALDAAPAPAASALATPTDYENKVAKTVDASAIDQQLDALEQQIAATPK